MAVFAFRFYTCRLDYPKDNFWCDCDMPHPDFPSGENYILFY